MRRARIIHASARALCVVALALCAHVVARAASFEDYRSRVSSAFNYAVDLGDALGGDGGAVDETRAARALTSLRATLPPRERVESAVGSIEVDNRWLEKELAQFDAAHDNARRIEIVARVVERLDSLKQELDATAAANTSARDKEAEKGRLQTILRRPEYNQQAAHGGALQSLWESVKDFLRRLIPRSKPLSASRYTSPLSVAARLFIYALAAAVIVFVLWRFGPSAWAQLSARRRRKSQAREARIILGERLAADESAADLISDAERLARAGDLRGAIRKAYIAVLCELGDRKVIRLARHKTNRDYLANVRDRADLYQLLHPLTHSFERHWYGFDPATPTDWDEYRALCNRAIQY